MMKRYDIDDAMAYFHSQEKLDVMDQSMLSALTYLESHNLRGHVMPEYGRIELKFGHGGCPFTMNIEFDALRETATASIVLPMYCIKEKRTVLSELLHRINFITVLGEWDLDPNDGECVIKYTHYIGDTPMSVQQTERMIDIPLMEAHRYEGTIIPLMMGREPDSDESCQEYKKMVADEVSGDGLHRLLMDVLQTHRRGSEEISEFSDKKTDEGI